MMNTRRLLSIGLVANLFEYYEYSIFAYFAVTLGQLFFNSTHMSTGIIQGFLIFASSYLVRPLGALYFGYLSDVKGRGVSLKQSLMMVALPAALVGCLPTYATAGYLATVCLVFLRLVQGFGMGGEMPSNVCYMFEAAAPRQRNILVSVPDISSVLGMLLGSLVAALLFWKFDNEDVLAWAWRLPFCLSIPLVVFIAYLRRALPESIASLPLNRTQKESLLPYLKNAIPLMPIVALMQTVGFLTVFWMPTYLTHFLEYPLHWTQLINTLTMCFLPFFILIISASSRIIDYRTIIQSGVVGILLSIIPLIYALQKASYSQIWMIQVGLILLLAMLQGVMMQLLCKQFPKNLRARGVGFIYMLLSAIVGGTAPALCTYLIKKTGLVLFPGFYIFGFALLALPGTLTLKNRLTQYDAE